MYSETTSESRRLADRRLLVKSRTPRSAMNVSQVS